MPDSIRKLVLVGLKTRLETITLANGYRNDVGQVEFVARRIDEIAEEDLPHIGIVPGPERYTDSVGRVVANWSIDLVVNTTHITDLTGLSGIEELSDWTSDIRKALYDSATLGVSGVCAVRVLTRQGSEAHPEAAEERKATMVLGIEIEFEEGIDS